MYRLVDRIEDEYYAVVGDNCRDFVISVCEELGYNRSGLDLLITLLNILDLLYSEYFDGLWSPSGKRFF